MPEAARFTGTIEKIFFQNEQGYAIGQLVDEASSRRIRFRGMIPGLLPGRCWQIEGSWVEHPRYGRQLEVTSAAPVVKPLRDTLIRFLSGSDFKGVGEKLAARIVETLGTGCLDTILKDSSVLETKCQIKPEIAQAVYQGLAGLQSSQLSMSRLVEWGLSQSQMRLLRQLPDEIAAKLKEDPFFPYYTIPGFGYEAGLKLADGFGLETHDIRRTEAAVLHELSRLCYGSGSTCISLPALEQRLNLSTDLLKEALKRLEARRLALEADGLVYLRSLYLSEKIIARQIENHLYPVTPPDEAVLNPVLAAVQKKNGIVYDPGQLLALKTFFSSSIMILNGGPGTGKSTILAGLIQMMEILYPRAPIQLCAPTGRAAKRMTEVASVPARTIHSLLKWDPDTDSFSVDEDAPLPCRFLIVDEFSMVDSRLFASLLKGVSPRCKILLIGDEDQLESVGPGNVLQDLIASGLIPVVRLETLHRQKKGSGIAILAAQIRRQQPLTFLDPVDFLCPQGGTLDCLKARLLLEDDPESVQVLAPKYAGESGILAINAMMQQLINPFDPSLAQLVTHVSTSQGRVEVIFREKDKVLLKQNFPELGVFNGDIGRIVEINQATKCVIVSFGEEQVEFGRGELSCLAHAWCISIHKSQGSEYQKTCVIADHNGYGMLKKRLLYTAVSRAKASLTIISEEKLFRLCAMRNDLSRRQTTLVRRLHEVHAFSLNRQQDPAAAPLPERPLAKTGRDLSVFPPASLQQANAQPEASETKAGTETEPAAGNPSSPAAA